MSKLSVTTKNVGLIHQLFQDGQLDLAPEFQRLSVWPPPARAYLIDTILNDRPMPLFFLQRARSAQTGRTVYQVIDGQQRLRAILDFLEGAFSLTQSKGKRRGKCFDELEKEDQNRILDYDLAVQELSGYGPKDIRDIFVRMNRYVVKLSPQELRHASESGVFAKYVERIGGLPFWQENRVFTQKQLRRFRAVEFAAELVVLLIEGPQDKKSAVDLYYSEYRRAFGLRAQVDKRLQEILSWIQAALPDLSRRRYRKPTDLYALVGAVDSMAGRRRVRSVLDSRRAGERLRSLESEVSAAATSRGNDYAFASSRQTDNKGPRERRIAIIKAALEGSHG